MTVKPRVSVVIPTHNRSAVIGRAIDSAVCQTFEDIEVIVVDDASTDDTGRIIEAYDDPRIRYTRHDTNRYAAAARNTGMAMANGEFIAFLDSDDEWLPHHLEVQIAALTGKGPEWGCVYGGAHLFKDGSTTSQLFKPVHEGWIVREYLTSRAVIWTPTFMFRSTCLAKVGNMDTTLVRGQDRDFYIRLLKYYKIAKVDEPISNIYLETQKSIADISLTARRLLLEKHDALLVELGRWTRRQAYAMQWMLQAEAFFAEGRLPDGLHYFSKSVVTYPFLPFRRYLAAGFKCLSGNFGRTGA